MPWAIASLLASLGIGNSGLPRMLSQAALHTLQHIHDRVRVLGMGARYYTSCSVLSIVQQALWRPLSSCMRSQLEGSVEGDDGFSRGSQTVQILIADSALDNFCFDGAAWGSI